ncbi:Allantoin catabolism protein [Neorhizobium galegae bv. officinalis]|nr:Allantoin catabolism protein [Neorhizobium galegae bv. officinalis]
MTSGGYFSQVGGLPPQTQTLSSKAVFTTAYAVIPKTVMSDIVTSVLPHWEKTRAWILSRPLSGFAETFAQYIMEVAPGGGSVMPEPDPRAQAAIFVVEGEGTITYEGQGRPLRSGSFAYLPTGAQWTFRNDSSAPIRFHWVRKVFKAVEGLDPPPTVFTLEDECVLDWMPDTEEAWGTTRFLDPNDVRHDFHLNIVTFEPGAKHPLHGNPHHGARALRVGRQSRLSAEQRLVRSRGRRLHVAARLLPAGLLCRWPGTLSLPALQGRQPTS